jgi:Domain of unknown function (DUF1841)
MMATKTSYDPEIQPNSAEWLAESEQERIRMAMNFHMANRLKSGNAKAHAVVHVIVENQIAMGFGPSVRAIERLRHQGLSRHDCVHAIGAVLSEYMFSAMRKPADADRQALQSQINAAIERLTAESWRSMYGK